ncbi:YceG-like family protein [Paenibacillus sophorae]|uniref:Endolytic transglycosylase MltG n=1 Tax=Paenibacillus sophorae TaxID=1333845 RepID=A0A1H8GA90_9BACL|nr:endolytic transglycosylase MltG [Paenibacillus sophorae]QWU14149.1 endolytic transglycosylase MltG [Paenibacillus sophorae]SEN40675.1 YceG-like family protein [Paenibacillus sophorae]
MIRNRSFMIGLGCGLAAGALLLQLMISAGMATPTKTQIAKEASKLNMKVADAGSNLLTAEEWRSLAQQEEASKGQDAAGKVNSGSTSQPPASPSPVAQSQPASPPNKAAAPTAPASPTKPSAVASPSPDTYAEKPVVSSIVLRIPRGANLTEVSDLLAGAGVIHDKDAFLDAARSRKANTRIQYGMYSFEAGQSVESIIDELVMAKK